MSGSAQAGALIYAKDLARLSDFYQQLLSMRLLFAGPLHQVIASADMQLIIHAMPEQIASAVNIAVPPVPRDSQAIKLFFTVPCLLAAETLATQLGGGLFGQIYPGPGFKVRNGFDPEGNILHLRESCA